jgi:demethylmenaquinone methyltransferase/2-methoxy-6-polyprenyl-1,4-benzoquinol methylase
MNTDLASYYARRAGEYDRVYHKPERQNDLALLTDRLRALLAGHRVLEVACGTGYWTEAIADVTTSIVATDINPEVLEIARAKRLPDDTDVRFIEADAYTLEGVGDGFDAALTAFWWSHIPKSRVDAFLRSLHQRLMPGALVVICDNLYIEGSNTPISRTDDEGNTYQMRGLEDGSAHEVLKNFPDETELRRALPSTAREIGYEALPYYWLLWYRL